MRSLSLAVCLALVATLLPAGSAAAHHADPATPQTVLVNSTFHAGGDRLVPNDVANPSVSADGTTVVFESHTVGGCWDPSAVSQVDCTRLWSFTREVGAVHGELAIIDLPVHDGHAGPDADTLHPAVSGDGRYVAFVSGAENLDAFLVDENRNDHVYRYDLLERVLVQVDVHGDVPLPPPVEPVPAGTGFVEGVDVAPITISHAGDRIAFASAENWNAGDAIFVWDELDGYAWPASLREGGLYPRRSTDQPALSPDGRWLAYVTPADMRDAESAVPGDIGPRVWLQELELVGMQPPTLVTEWTTDEAALEWGSQPSVSDPVGEGSLPYVAFTTPYPVAGEQPDPDNGDDVYRWDGNGGEPAFLRLSPASPAEGAANSPSISADGSRVAFASDLPDLVGDDTNGRWDAFVATVVDGEVAVERASVTTAGQEGPFADGGIDGGGEVVDTLTPSPAIAGGGSAVTFATRAILDEDAGDRSSFVYVRDLDDGLAEPPVLTAGITPTNATPRAGEPTNVRISFHDPLGDVSSRYTYDLAWGDGAVIERQVIDANAAAEGGGTAGELDLEHTYAETGAYTITLTVRVEEGPEPGREATATPREVTVGPGPALSIGAPVFDPASPVEGQPVTATFPYQDEDGRVDAASVHWGDGTSSPATTEMVGGQRYLSASHTYRSHGTLRVFAQVTDDESEEHAFHDTDLTVGNVAPVIATVTRSPELGGTAPLEVTVTAQFTDPGWANVHTATVEWGDGTDTSTPATVAFADGEGTATAAYTYTAAGTYTATVTVSDGTDTDVESTTVEVAAPSMTVQVHPYLVGGQRWVVGDSVGAEIAAYDDSDRAPYEWRLDWGDGAVSSGTGVGAVLVSDGDGNYELAPRPMDTHVYEAPGTYEVIAQVRPEGTSAWVASTPVQYVIAAVNAAPEVTTLTVTPAQGAAPHDVQLEATFEDADVDDVLTASIDWGDGTTSVSGTDAVQLSAEAGFGTVTATHTFTTPAVEPYTVTLTVHDGTTSGAASATVQVDAPVASPATPIISDLWVDHPSRGAEGGPQVLAGARDVPIADIPLEDLSPRSNDPLGAPLHRIDLAATPLHRIPLHRIPLHRIGTGDEFAPLTLGDLALDSLPLATVGVTEVPLRRVGGWGGLIAGSDLAGQPLQTLTLADVHGAGLLAGIGFDEIDLAATPLRNLSLASVLLGDVRLEDVPVPGTEEGDTTTWCTYLAALGTPCGDFQADDRIIGAEYAGLPLDSSGVTATPLHRIDVNGVPLHRIDVEGIPLHRIPLHRIPLHRIDLNVSPLHRIPLHRIPLHRIGVQETPLHRIPLHRIPLHRIGEVVDCQAIDCTEAAGMTLADAFEAGALLDTATLGALGELPADLTIGHLLYLIAVAIEGGEEVDGLEITFNDVLVGLLEAIDYPWEELPFGRMGVSRFAPHGGQVPLTYGVDFSLDGRPGASDATVRITLPEGFTVVQRTGFTRPVAELRDAVDDGSTSFVPIDVDGSVVTADLKNVAHGADLSLIFEARPGITLGSFGSDVRVTVGGDPEEPSSAELLDQAAVTVLEHWEDAGARAPATAPQLSGDTVYLSHLGSEGDVDYFRVPVAQAGERISIRLTNLDADADLVLYQPWSPSSVPLHRIGTDSLPLDDEGYSGDAPRTDLPPEVLQDVPVEISPLHRISANRGDADEVVEVVSTGADVSSGGYIIQVSGYNGAATDTPYALRVRVTDPPAPPVCTNTFPHDVPAPTDGTWDLSEVPVDTDTLFLLNEHRLRRLHDGAAVDEVIAAIDELVASSAGHGTNAAVVALDRIPAVVEAYEGWDAAGRGCVPAAANAVVESIAQVVDDVRASRSGTANVVVLGGDDVVPFARMADTTRYNQSTYADLVGDVNPISAAFATEHLLSDDPYGDALGTPWLNRRLHVSEIAVGRVVESPTDIAAQLRQFVASGGRVDPSSALVTGYDFLTDGAQAVATGLAQGTTQRRAITPTELIDEAWSRQDVIDGLFGGADAPGIASVNAHYDHARSLPAAPHADGSEDDADLFTIDDVEADRLVGRILFTMGCHAGLAVPDGYVGGEVAAAGDWAQTLGRELAVYVANTGYGYGDDTAVALSEKLMATLAGNLDGTMSVGDALAAAKHDYVSGMGVYGSYDEKVVQQTVLYGLPMYRVGPDHGTGSEPTDPGDGGDTSTGTVTDPTTGLQVAPAGTALAGGGLEQVSTDRGTYWQVEGEDPQVTHWRPIQPKTVLDVTREGLAARGALITGLASHDTTGVDAVFARPAVGPSAQEPEIEFGGVAFPARLSNLSTGGGPEGRKDRLALMPGQFFSDVASGSTAGTQRLFTRMDALVYYADPGDDDLVPPAIDRSVAVTEETGGVSFSVDVSDASGVERVLVLFKDASGLWTPLDLVTGPDGRWSGSSPANVGNGDVPVLEWFVQAVDGSGNVAASTNKGEMFPASVVDPDAGTPTEPAPPAVAAPTFTGTEGRNGWFTSGVTITAPAGHVVSPSSIDTDGMHLVTVSNGGGTATYVVGVDASAPTPIITAPSDGAEITMAEPLAARYSCADATSGVVSCEATVTPPAGAGAPTAVTSDGQLPTSGPGWYELEVVATDRAGNTATARSTYLVVGHRYEFDGFFAPIADEAVNQVKAGQSVPLKFRVWDGDELVQDLSVLDVSVVVTSCPSSGGSNTVVEQVSSSQKAELRWDPIEEQFVYVHRSDRKWTGCRKVVVDVAHPDGWSSSHEVVFSYQK